MRVAFGADEHCMLTEAVLADLLGLRQQVIVVADGEPWLDVSLAVAHAVAAGDADRGVLCCRKAVEASGVAGGVVGVRSALCTDVAAVRLARSSDANVMALAIGVTAPRDVGPLVAASVEDE